ncbi:Protein N-acetyltransferase, RimJ/RimL family [Lentibacillus halodurans]|uniref:Protein N-acetyltransferase, RimJ/RimL family n=1 Tax=Lentibacillus halodurans TaxID=237679 RepID=A0A1I0X2T7_9BACI|nr:GNAT family N-acetyltransferase [Lentibacillus halodurans]SFA94730.1 Protein N-acetyltransferase, RimJ/RimL family [Lentibacillus halodurans]
MIRSTERLLFRSYQDDDFSFLMSLLADREVVRFIGDGQTKNRSEAEKFLHWIYNTYEYGSNMGLRLLIDKKDRIPIGHAGLVPQTIDGKEEIEIGYWIARKYWGQGYAAEAALGLRNYGIQQLDIQRLIALIQSGNTVSELVAKKIGMHFDRRITLSGKAVNVYAT